jgi:predicted transcriptional regulator
LEISVKPSPKKPHYALDENGKWLAYSRINDENVLVHQIQLLVWKKQSSNRGIYFSYTEIEKILIDYLVSNKSISLTKFIRLAHISRKKAEEVLSNFATMDVIKINSSGEKTDFSLNPEFDLTTLGKL